MRRVSAALLPALVLVVLASSFAAAQDPPQPQPILTETALKGSTIFTVDDIGWLLHLRKGEPLPTDPAEIAQRLAALYEREGFTGAKVSAVFDAGKLLLEVDEGLFTAIDFEGANSRLRGQLERSLAQAGVKSGEPFNEPVARKAIDRVLAPTNGGFALNEIGLVEVAGGRHLRIAVQRDGADFSAGFGTNGREDLFSPVDGLSLSLGFKGVVYDRSGFNYTFVGGFGSWKFGRNDGGYSIGMERSLLSNTRLFLGGDFHDVTASDDAWRLVDIEQTIAAAGFKNTFRDYYRRRGGQAHIGARPNAHNEFVVSWRWDRHEPLPNETDFSLFRTDREYRPNPLVVDADLGALVLAYSFDTRGLDDDSISERYARHLVEDLFRAGRRNRSGLRVDWTSEIAGRAMGGDYEFTRHILNARGALDLGRRQSVAARGIFGWSDGTLPIERQFALGGVGSVRAYKFKEAVGTDMALFNAEYGLTLLGPTDPDTAWLRVLFFYDAGRVGHPLRGSDDWLSSVGVGVQTGPIRVEWGFKTDDSSHSAQVLVRLGRTF